MTASVAAALRERLTYRSAVGWLVVVAAFEYLFGFSPVQIGFFLAMGAVSGVADLLVEEYGLRSEVQTLGLGLVTLIGGVGVAAYDGAPEVVSTSMVLVATWLVLDAGQVLRHEGVREETGRDDRDGTEVYLEHVETEVHEAIRERPRTRLELRDALDADDESVDRAAERLAERGVVVREGSELRIPSDDASDATRLRRWVSDAIGRLARPVTIEFDEDRGSRA